MLIDSHVHVTPDGKWFNTNHDASVEHLLEEMEQQGIDRAVLLPISPFVPNEFVARICTQHHERFVAAVSVDPAKGKHAVSELRDYLGHQDLRLLKLHPKLQCFDPLSNNVLKLLEVCAEHEVPAMFDCFPLDRHRPIADSMPLVFDRLAKLIPSVKIILAHSGGHRVLDACMVAKSNTNIYLDISFSPTFYQGSSVLLDLEFAIRKVGGGRTLYGSDFPEVRIGPALEAARHIVRGLPEVDKELIFGGTARKLLRLVGESH